VIAKRTCTGCGEFKAASEFSKRSDGQPRSECKECRAAKQRKREAEVPAEVKARQMAAYRAGIRKDKCAVCGSAIEGEGLCSRCRAAVFVLGDLEGLKRAVKVVKYLEGA
jgi:hypothetical protein